LDGQKHVEKFTSKKFQVFYYGDFFGFPVSAGFFGCRLYSTLHSEAKVNLSTILICYRNRFSNCIINGICCL